MKTALTDRAIKAMRSSAKAYDIHDAVVPGLSLRILPSGVKSFVVLTRFPGARHPTRRALGASLSIYGMSLAISLFITILMIYSGFQGIDPNKVKLALTFGASKGQILRKVVLPGSVPTLIAALKVNAGLSLVGVVVGEFQSANLGLGYLIQYGSQIFKMNIVMTAITILAIVSSVMYLAISWLESAVMRRR